MIYRRRARDEHNSGANWLARFEPPAGSDSAIFEAAPLIFNLWRKSERRSDGKEKSTNEKVEEKRSRTAPRINEKSKKGVQHEDFPGGHPS